MVEKRKEDARYKLKTSVVVVSYLCCRRAQRWDLILNGMYNVKIQSGL